MFVHLPPPPNTIEVSLNLRLSSFASRKVKGDTKHPVIKRKLVNDLNSNTVKISALGKLASNVTP